MFNEGCARMCTTEEESSAYRKELQLKIESRKSNKITVNQKLL
jgi:hypothetical protein